MLGIDPFGLAGDAAERVGTSMVAAFANWVLGWLADLVAATVDGLVNVLLSTTTLSLDGGWWTSPERQRLSALVAGIAAALLLGFLLLGLIRSTVTGEGAGPMVRAFVIDLPVTVIGTVSATAITAVLLGVTDAASAAVLGDVGDAMASMSAPLTAASMSTGGAMGAVFAVLFVVGGVLLWLQLLIRSSLIYLVIMFAPLALAARVYPGARHVARRTIEVGVALIVAKFAVAVTLALGATASGTAAIGDLPAMATGMALMVLAAFMPTVVFKVVALFEAAGVADGIERGPARAATTVAAMAVTASSITRIANTGTNAAAAAAVPTSVPAGGQGGGGAQVLQTVPVGAGTGGSGRG